MMRLTGVILLLLSAGGFGMMRAMDLKQRPKSIRSMIDALLLLRADILSRGLYLPDALAHVDGMSSGCAKTFFGTVSFMLGKSAKPFDVIWEESLDSLGELGREERDIIRRLGAHLGRLDAAAQGKAIDTSILLLEAAERQAKTYSQQYSRLYTGLGLTVGAMLAVVLY